MALRLTRLRALEILDSRGRPTVEVTAELAGGIVASAQVPSGASTGTREAKELRDGDPTRYGGLGVLRACRNIEQIIAPELSGADAEDHPRIDASLIQIDGTPDKSRIGANAVLAVSCAVARAVATARREPLWSYLNGSFDGNRLPVMPRPMVNIFSGGLHAGRNIEFQDFLVMPSGFSSFAERMQAIVQVHQAAYRLLLDQGYVLTGVADEGGWGPQLENNGRALELLTTAIEKAGFQPGRDFEIAIDVAATHFHRNGRYELATERRSLTSEGMIDQLQAWTNQFPVCSIEDGLDENDHHGWRCLTRRLGEKVQIVGDDLLTTNPVIVRDAIDGALANAVLVKMNQIGTLTETFAVIEMARKASWTAVISARSGETEDSFLADLAVASGAGQIKIGSITRSERLAKYNRLLAIERELG